MQTLASIAIYIISTLGTLYVSLVLIRFLAQLVRADYYNPVSKALVKYTNPLLVPLRKVIPGIMGIDFAALVLAILLQAALLQSVYLIAGLGLFNPFMLLLWALVALLSLLAGIYFWGVLIMMIASWVAQGSRNPALGLLQQILEPVMAPFRKLLPPFGALDLSPILFFMLLNILRSYLLPALANITGMVSIPGFSL
jgi:YggT family protein